MEKQYLDIEGIPSIIWGHVSNNVFVAVHGDQSNKEDTVIRIFAEIAASKGYCVLSFDLPEHGERKKQPVLCKAQTCVKELQQIMEYALLHWSNIKLFGCSIGAYFSMLAYRNEQIQQALFLSPVVDMRRIICNMMTWFNISEEQLKNERQIKTPMKTLYWDYYRYVLNHPVVWNKPTAILYGAKDNLCEFTYVERFANQTNASMTILEDGEHFFHTDTQLAFFQEWVERVIA